MVMVDFGLIFNHTLQEYRYAALAIIVNRYGINDF